MAGDITRRKKHYNKALDLLALTILPLIFCSASGELGMGVLKMYHPEGTMQISKYGSNQLSYQVTTPVSHTYNPLFMFAVSLS